MTDDESEDGETDYSPAIHDEPESTTIRVDVVKPIEEVTDAGEPYPMHMKMQIGTGETEDGTEFRMDHNLGGGISISFDDGPRVDFDLNSLAGAAVRAANEAGYDIDADSEYVESNDLSE